MRAAWVMALLLTASAPKVLVGEALPPEFAVAGQPAPINSLAFARRDPLPGRPSYLETIKYIDDGVRYIDALSQFFIHPRVRCVSALGPITRKYIIIPIIDIGASIHNLWTVYRCLRLKPASWGSSCGVCVRTRNAHTVSKRARSRTGYPHQLSIIGRNVLLCRT